MILVTGGAGFIGSHVCEALNAGGMDFDVLDNFSRACVTREWLLHLNHCFAVYPKVYTGNYDAIVHLAACPFAGPDYFSSVLTSNFQLTQDLFKTFPGTPVVFASSAAAKFNRTLYGVSKLAGEILLQSECYRPHVSLRFENVYGPRNRKGFIYHALQAKHNQKDFTVVENKWRDFIYVQDVVNAVVMCTEDMLSKQELSNRVFSVGVGLGVLLDAVVDMLGMPLCKHSNTSSAWDVDMSYATKDRLKYIGPGMPLTQGLKLTEEWFLANGGCDVI